jgi:hypothetical protein
VERLSAQFGGRPFFHDAAEVHHQDAVGQVFHDGQIVRNEEVCQPMTPLQILQEIHDLGLDTDIQRTDGFIADEEPGFHGQGSRDADALTLPAAELMRISVTVRGLQPDGFQEVSDPLFPRCRIGSQPVDVEGFSQDLSDGEARVQGTEGILEDHLEVASLLAQGAPFEPGEVGAAKSDDPGGDGPQAYHGPSQCRLAATAFTQETHGFAGPECETHVFDGVDDTSGLRAGVWPDRKPDAEVLDSEQGIGGHGRSILGVGATHPMGVSVWGRSLAPVWVGIGPPVDRMP